MSFLRLLEKNKTPGCGVISFSSYSFSEKLLTSISARFFQNLLDLYANRRATVTSFLETILNFLAILASTRLGLPRQFHAVFRTYSFAVSNRPFLLPQEDSRGLLG